MSAGLLAVQALDALDADYTISLADIPLPGAWADRGRCRTAPSTLFFIGRGDDSRPAKAICARCAVRDQCLEYAVEAGQQLRGIWGGTSEKERRALRHDRLVHTDEVEPHPPEPLPTPTPTRQVRSLYSLLEQLLDHPGRWAQLATYPSAHSGSATASLYRNGHRPVPQGGAFTFEGRVLPDGGSALYARHDSNTEVR